LKLLKHQVEKPWGRIQIPAAFGGDGDRRIGEVWFESPCEMSLPLLVKYIFTSEKLSIQVHPDDHQARQRGLAQGKSESWYILHAEPDSQLGLGLTQQLSATELRQAALDGSIEQFIDWKPVDAGDFVFVPAGTIHAIGKGVTLLEFQQNSDATYRLYDYGRPRELHLDDAVAVSSPRPYDGHLVRQPDVGQDAILLNGPHFSLARATSTEAIPVSMTGRRRWIAPLEGAASSGTEAASVGECLLLEPHAPLSIAGSSAVLVGCEGSL
jgi:mannose-6-phosphate isomerase